MSNEAEVFEALRKIMLPYAARLDCSRDSAQEQYVNGKHLDKKGKRRTSAQSCGRRIT